MDKEEQIAIQTLKEVASDRYDTLGDDISPKMAQNILNVIDKQQKEIKDLKEKHKTTKQMNENLIEVVKDSVSKDKIRELLKSKDIELTGVVSYRELEELLEEK